MKLNKKWIAKCLLITGALGIIVVPTAAILTSCSSGSDNDTPHSDNLTIKLKYQPDLEIWDINKVTHTGAYVVDSQDISAINACKNLTIKLDPTNIPPKGLLYVSLPGVMGDHHTIEHIELDFNNIKEIVMNDGSNSTYTPFPDSIKSITVKNSNPSSDISLETLNIENQYAYDSLTNLTINPGVKNIKIDDTPITEFKSNSDYQKIAVINDINLKSLDISNATNITDLNISDSKNLNNIDGLKDIKHTINVTYNGYNSPTMIADLIACSKTNPNIKLISN